MSIISTLLSNLNYGTIFFLMLLESTVIPVPSELVVAPAAYHSAAGNLDIWLVILFSTLGADAGASINYLAGWLLGRPVIWRFADSKLGKLCMLSHEKIEKSEAYFNNHGMVATITGRLINLLQMVYHNVKHYFQMQIDMQDVNQVLASHFNDFGVKVRLTGDFTQAPNVEKRPSCPKTNCMTRSWNTANTSSWSLWLL